METLKKLLPLFLALFLSSSLFGISLSQEEADEIIQIVQDLEKNNEELQKSNSELLKNNEELQKSNSELLMVNEALFTNSQALLEDNMSLSESNKNLSRLNEKVHKDYEKSLIKLKTDSVLTTILSAVISFFVGGAVGMLLTL